MKYVCIAVCSIFVIALTACTQRNEPKPAPTGNSGSPRLTYRDIVDSINARVPGMTMVAGTYSEGNETSDYRAYYDKGVLQFIHEHLDMGQSGSSVNRYYFQDGALLYIEEDKLSRGISQGGNPQTRAIVEWMVFDSTGTAIQAEKQVDGKPRAPDEDESKAILRHTEEVANAASKKMNANMHSGVPGGGTQ